MPLFTIALDFMFLNREGYFPAGIVDQQLLNTRSVLQKDGSGLQIIKSEFVTGGSQNQVIALKESWFFLEVTGPVHGYYQIYPENAETIRYAAIVKRKVLIFVSQSIQLKFSNLNTRSNFSRMIF